MTAFFCCLELPGQSKRSALLEAVEVSMYWDTFATAATLYAAWLKLGKNRVKPVQIKPAPQKKTSRMPFARATDLRTGSSRLLELVAPRLAAACCTAADQRSPAMSRST